MTGHPGGCRQADGFEEIARAWLAMLQKRADAPWRNIRARDVKTLFDPQTKVDLKPSDPLSQPGRAKFSICQDDFASWSKQRMGLQGLKNRFKQHFLVGERRTAAFGQHDPIDGKGPAFERYGTDEEIDMNSQALPFRPVNNQDQLRQRDEQGGEHMKIHGEKLLRTNSGIRQPSP